MELDGALELESTPSCAGELSLARGVACRIGHRGVTVRTIGFRPVVPGGL